MATRRMHADETDGTSDAKGNWIAVVLTGVVAIAVGLAGGFVIGDRRGKSTNAREAAEAKLRDELSTQAAKALEEKVELLSTEHTTAPVFS